MIFCQYLLPWWGKRRTPSWDKRRAKQPKFNTECAIAKESWVTCRVPCQRLSSRVHDVNFFATFLLRGEAGIAPRREMSGARTSSLNVTLLSRCSSVVRWAVPQTAKVQQCTCHYCPIYCPSRAKQLGDLWIAAPTTLELRLDVIFWQILLPWWGERYVKKPKLNNALASIVLREQNSWATSGSLRQRLQSCAPTWIFCQTCCRGEVSGTWKSQSSTTHMPLLS